MATLHTRLRLELERLEAASRLRELRPPHAVDCSSNDYLGLARDPEMLAAARAVADLAMPVGSGGSRLLSGTHQAHLDAESCFAEFVGRDAALLFSTGFAANMALLSALPTRHDLILLDAAAHASLKEGARASLAPKRVFAHNDPTALAAALHDRDRFADVYVVVEGLYSMDGDTARLAELGAVAERVGAHLIVDEAHATGLYGERLRGVHETAGLATPPLATVHPCGKALGASGAFIAADRHIIAYLINTARPFLFSTAMPPAQAALLARSVRLLPSMAPRAEAVRATAALLRQRLRLLSRWHVLPGDGPIVPVVVGADSDAVLAAAAIADHGFDVRPIRPPTVPDGAARLRISITHGLGEDQVMGLADAIIAAERIVAAGPVMPAEQADAEVRHG